MSKFKQSGDILDLTAPSGGVVAGSFYKIGAIIVFANATAAEGDLFGASIKHAFDDVPAQTTQAWTEGAVVYWDDTAKLFTTTATANTKCGIATAAKASAEALGSVRLIPAI